MTSRFSYRVIGDAMYHVLITGYHLSDTNKPFYVYTIELKDETTGAKYFIEKRYSEFNALHRTLKKENSTAPFPPKRVRNCQTKVLEQRRADLEFYIQKMLQLSTTKQQVLEFLGIKNRETVRIISKRLVGNTDLNEPEDENYTLDHHPVITFQCDPYINIQINNNINNNIGNDDSSNSSSSTSLPDIIIQGSLLGLYK